jgi:hypothetical protein
MSVDLPAAVAFLATHGRVLDRRRLELLGHGGDSTTVLAALEPVECSLSRSGPPEAEGTQGFRWSNPMSWADRV